MIHVGYEFEIDRSRLRSYAVDYGVAATAAAVPWILGADARWRDRPLR
jgi:hypothetical protein